MKKLYGIGTTLFFGCSTLLFLGFCFDDGSIQLDESYNWIGTLWTILFLLSCLLILVGIPFHEQKSE